MRLPAHPGLYEVDDAQVISLAGTRCSDCGTAFFPPLRIGCEVCGASEDELVDVKLAGSGRIHASATVHLHHGRGIEAPFTVAEIVLDDGPVVRGLMASNAELSVGTRVEGKWFVTKVDNDGNEIVEPCFEAME